jgi:hypothetical protein
MEMGELKINQRNQQSRIQNPPVETINNSNEIGNEK